MLFNQDTKMHEQGDSLDGIGEFIKKNTCECKKKVVKRELVKEYFLYRGRK